VPRFHHSQQNLRSQKLRPCVFGSACSVVRHLRPDALCLTTLLNTCTRGGPRAALIAVSKICSVRSTVRARLLFPRWVPEQCHSHGCRTGPIQGRVFSSASPLPLLLQTRAPARACA
jgi:hypothetical protein